MHPYIGWSTMPRAFSAPVEPWEREVFAVSPAVQRAALRMGAAAGCTAFWAADDWIRPLREYIAAALGPCYDLGAQP